MRFSIACASVLLCPSCSEFLRIVSRWTLKMCLRCGLKSRFGRGRGGGGLWFCWWSKAVGRRLWSWLNSSPGKCWNGSLCKCSTWIPMSLPSSSRDLKCSLSVSPCFTSLIFYGDSVYAMRSRGWLFLSRTTGCPKSECLPILGLFRKYSGPGAYQSWIPPS